MTWFEANPCPLCGAQAWQTCTTPKGTPARTSHRARQMLAYGAAGAVVERIVCEAIARRGKSYATKSAAKALAANVSCRS